MKRLACYSALALLGIASSLANAHGYRDEFDYARVTRVEPIYETTTYRVPRDECWNEEVPVRSSSAPRSYTGPVLGAIIGGAVGNALGHHDVNKKVGAIAGAALGASVGRDVSNRNRDDYDTVSYRDQRVCKAVSDTEAREEVVAYRVFYRYNGRDFVTRMPEDPGSRIRVRVNVEPDEYR